MGKNKAFDPFGVSEEAEIAALDLAKRENALARAEEVGDAEERETIVRTRKARLHALRVVPQAIRMCEDIINSEADDKVRLLACREIREFAGVARVPVPQVYVDARTVTVGVEDADFLRRLGMYSGPDPVAKTKKLPNGDIIDAEVVPTDESLPEWAR